MEWVLFDEGRRDRRSADLKGLCRAAGVSVRTGKGDSLDLAAMVGDSLNFIESHPHLGSTWMRLWEQSTSEDFARSWTTTVRSWRKAMPICSAI